MNPILYIEMVCLEVLRYHIDRLHVLHHFRDFSISNLEHLWGELKGKNGESRIVLKPHFFLAYFFASHVCEMVLLILCILLSGVSIVEIEIHNCDRALP
jgi:hypothetical protein